jgi:hypothetical protein
MKIEQTFRRRKFLEVPGASGLAIAQASPARGIRWLDFITRPSEAGCDSCTDVSRIHFIFLGLI